VGDDRKQDPVLAQLMGRMNELDERNRDLELRLAEVAQVNVISGTLFNGFQDVIAELRPLRDLTPQREPVEDGPADAAAEILAAMQGVTLPGGSIQVPEAGVPFIGQFIGPRPDVDQSDVSQTAGRPRNQNQRFRGQTHQSYEREN
jgi:hypothetical protein